MDFEPHGTYCDEMEKESHSVPIAVALIGAAATITAALIVTQPWARDEPVDVPAEPSATSTFPDFGDLLESASVFLSRDSGPAGTTVNVSGTGFVSGERVVLRFHTEQIGSTNANAEGSFSNVAVVIPSIFSGGSPFQFSIIASGQESLKSPRAPFTLTG